MIKLVQTRRYDKIPPLPDMPDRYYVIPPSPPAKLNYRGLPLDQLEDLLASAAAWRQAKRITHVPKPEFSGRPLTSLHQGHVALLCTSGMMNGCFGEGKDRHVAYWESVKVVDRREDGGGQDNRHPREGEVFTASHVALCRRADGVAIGEGVRVAFQKGGARCRTRTCAWAS